MVQAITPEDVAEGADVEFEEEREHWNSYRLKDGTLLQVKLVLTKVKRLNKWNPDGDPVYVIQSQNVVRVSNIPKELKRMVKDQTFKPV